MNNRQGAINNGHNAVLLMNSNGQEFLFSYYGPENYPWDDTGEMRFSVLSAGGIGYENKLLPNSYYELYKQNKTYWMNETGISRGVEI